MVAYFSDIITILSYIANYQRLQISSLFIVFQAKEEIRCLLPGGLQESISKVRSSVVSCFHVQRVIYHERLFLASLMVLV